LLPAVFGIVTRNIAGRLALPTILLFCGGCGLLLLAWLVGNPLGRAPDEPMHYVKAAALANGELRGGPTELSHAGYTDHQWKWARRQIRLFTLPPRIALAPAVPCPIFDPRVPAGCQHGWPTTQNPTEPSYLGTYQPYSYAPSAALMWLAPSPTSAYYLGRAGVALTSLALIALGVAALWHGPPQPASVVGVLLALTPATLFLASTLNVNGIEVVAGFCFSCGVLALGRWRLGDGGGGHVAWAATASGGVALAATRSLGPYFVVALAACLLVDDAGPRILRAVRARRQTASAVAAVIAAAAVLNVWWEHAFQPHLDAHLQDVVSHPTFAGIPHIAKQLVGGIGWLEFRLPLPVYISWGVLTLALVIGALAVGRWRERAAVVALVGGSFVLLVALHTVLGKQIGFDLQGRDLLPCAIAIPLLAGEVLRRHSGAIAGTVTRHALVPVGIAVALIQFVAWYFNARRHAVGTKGPVWFFGAADWAPPGGWPLWTAVALVAVVAVGTAGVTTFFAASPRDDAAAPTQLPAMADTLEGIA
jgi:hypothetical protein